MENDAQCTNMHSPLPDCPVCKKNDYRNLGVRLIVGVGTDIGYQCIGCSSEYLFTYCKRTGGLLFLVKKPLDKSSWTELNTFKSRFSQEELPRTPLVPECLAIFHQPEEGVWNQLTN